MDKPVFFITDKDGNEADNYLKAISTRQNEFYTFGIAKTMAKELSESFPSVEFRIDVMMPSICFVCGVQQDID